MVSLLPLAEEICRRYRDEFPDEAERYGDAGNAWCVHDNQHLLFWGAGAVEGWVNMERQVGWLANVLEARDFPLDRLARNLDLAAEVAVAGVDGDLGREVASVLIASATFIRLQRGTTSTTSTNEGTSQH